jgi:protein-tyrosine phosphatase
MCRVQPPSAPSSFGFLFVCTGNLCRSPFGQLLLSHLLTERLGEEVRRFRLASAGAQAVVGAGIHPDTRRELEPWGLAGAPADAFRATQLEPSMIERSDVVLTATVEHRAAVLRLSPSALPKTFTVLEFARLIAAIDPAVLPLDPVERAHALVQHAPAQRGRHRPGKPEDDSVADPMGRRRRAHRTAAQQIARAVTSIAEAVAP